MDAIAAYLSKELFVKSSPEEVPHLPPLVYRHFSHSKNQTGRYRQKPRNGQI